MRLTRIVWRLCWTWAYLVRAAAATVLPGHDPQPLPAARAPGADARARRGDPRGGRAAQRGLSGSHPRVYASRPDGTPRPRPACRRRRRPRVGARPPGPRAPRAARRAGRARARGRRARVLARNRLARPPERSHRAWRAAALGIVAVGVAAAILARRPVIVPVAVLLAAPFRPPLSFDSGGTFLVSIADDGRLGPPAAALLRARGGRHRARLARAARARAPPAPHGDRCAGGRLLRVRLPVAASGPTTSRRARTCSASSRCRSRCCSPRSRAPTSRDSVPRALAAAALGARDAVRAGWPVAGGDARALLLRAEPHRLERQQRLLPRDVAVRRPEPVRASSGARHRRGAGAPRCPALEAVAARRPARDHVGGALLLLLAVEHGGAARGHPRASRRDRRPPRAPDRRGAGARSPCSPAART